jgi:hypothetical protein
MKIKISDKDLTQCIKEALEERNTLNEAITPVSKDDVKAIVKKEIKDFLNLTNAGDLEKKVEKMVLDIIKNDKNLDKHFVDISKNVLIQLYKNLWTRRSFWSNDLKNSPN